VPLVRAHRHFGFAWKKIRGHHKHNAILWRLRNIKCSPRYPSSHFTGLPPPPLAVLILSSSNLFIYLLIYLFVFLIFTVGLLVFYLSSFILIFSSCAVTLFRICFFPAVLAVCNLGTPSSFTLFVSTPLSPWFYPIGCHHIYVLLPSLLSRIYVIGCWISFLLGLLTCEDGTDTLSRNVGKQLPHDDA
jgi:hypothetical protein